MIRRILAYIAIVLLTLYCFFLYDHTIVTIMLLMEVIYFPVAVLCLIFLHRHIHFSLVSMPFIAEKNQKMMVRINVENDSRIPVVHFQMTLRIENAFTGDRIVYKKNGTIGAGEKNEVVIPFKVKECGNISITLHKCIVYDFLYIFKSRIINYDVIQIGVLPECHLIPLEITRRTREFIADADEYSDRESGDDPSDIYQIREYREKDSIHDIHWKLSAKADELLVKEHGKPLGCVVLIWLDLSIDGKDKNQIRRKSVNALEMAASLSFSLLAEECVHMVSWYEPENGVVQKKRVSKEEHIYELLNRLLYVKPYAEWEDAEIQFEEAFLGENFSTIVKIGADGTVKVGDKQIDVPMEKKEIKWENLFFEL